MAFEKTNQVHQLVFKEAEWAGKFYDVANKWFTNHIMLDAKTGKVTGITYFLDKVLADYVARREGKGTTPFRGLLLVVDPRSGTAVLAGGYFLENLIGQEELDRVLKAASRDFSRADYPAAVQTITTALEVLLRRRAHESLRNPEQFQVPVPETVPVVFPPLVRTGEVSLLESISVESPPEPLLPPVEAAPPAAAGRTAGRTKSAAKRANPRRR